MDPIIIYAWKEDGKQYAYTKEYLEESTVPVEKADKSGVVQEKAILHLPTDHDEYHIYVKENFYRADRQKAEATLHVLNRRTNAYEYQQHRLYDAFAGQAISSWGFRQEQPNIKGERELIPVSEEGIGLLHDKIAETLVVAVWQRFNDEPVMFRTVHGRNVKQMEPGE